MSDFGPLDHIQNPFSFDAEIDDCDLRFDGGASALDAQRQRVVALLAERGLEYDPARLRFIIGGYSPATRMTTVRCLYDI